MTYDPKYQKRWAMDRAQGRTRLIDAKPVRVHIDSLLAARMSVRAIADCAGITPSAVSKIGSGRQAKVQRSTARAILAVTPEAAYTRPHGPGFVLNVGARRRIEALLALGWRHEDITAAMGTRTSSALVLHQVGGWIARDTHDAVCGAWRALGNRRGPSERTRGRAARLGYAPPAAWDEEDLDDPNAPTPDGYGVRHDQCRVPACAERPLADDLCSGHYHARRRGVVDVRSTVDLDEWAHLVRGGEHPDRAARRCGVTDAETVAVAARRSERADILRLLSEVRTGEAVA